MLSKPARQARAALASAAARASRLPDDPDAARTVEERRRDYRFVAATDYIRRVVDEAPPLTEQQRRELASLLQAGGADAA